MREMKVFYGKNYVKVKFAEPIVVDAISDSNAPFEEKFFIKLEQEREVIAIDSFFGHDRGDAYEIAIEVYSDVDGGRVENARDFLWRRIDEDTAPNNDEHMIFVLARPVKLVALKIYVLCRVTGKNLLVGKGHESHRRWRAGFDVNMILITT